MNPIKINKTTQGLDIHWGDFAPQDVRREFVPYHRVYALCVVDDTTIRALFTSSSEKDLPVQIIELNGVNYDTADDLLNAYIVA